MFAGPGHVLVVTDLEQQIELLRKQRVVVLQSKTEQREGVNERTTAYDHLRAPLRNEIECGEILEYSHGIGRAQDRYRAGETNAARSRRRRCENDGRRGIQEILTMVFSDSEDIQSDLISVFDLLDQVTQALRFTERSTGVSVRGREAINSDLHSSPPLWEEGRGKREAGGHFCASRLPLLPSRFPRQRAH